MCVCLGGFDIWPGTLSLSTYKTYNMTCLIRAKGLSAAAAAAAWKMMDHDQFPFVKAGYFGMKMVARVGGMGVFRSTRDKMQ